MNHSEKFELVLDFYNKGLWSLKRVHDAVGRWITTEEFKEITGKEYNE